MSKRLSSAVLALALAVGIGVAAAIQLRDDAVAAARSTYYARGVADGVARTETRLGTKAPADVATRVNGFCTGVLELAWFDASMNVTQEQVDAYAAESHECTGVRYLGSLGVTSYSGDTGTDYIYVLTLHGKETWWVFTLTSAGLIADIQ